MRSRVLLAITVFTAWLPALASSPLAQGQDYYSLQIASSQNIQVLKAIYQRYVQLPHVRIERRGKLYVLRAGFWEDMKAAQTSLSEARVDATLIRLAAYRPQAIVQRNWQESQPGTVVRQGAGPAREARSKLVLEPPDLTPPPEPMPAPLPSPPPPGSRPASEVKTVPGNAKDKETLRPFDEADFALAFDVLVGAGDLGRAFQIAQRAVQTTPESDSWRLKLAHISEWTQHPELAGEQWLALFQRGNRSAEVVSSVIRLAPLVDKPMLAVQAWAFRSEKTPLTEAQWRDIFNLYENASEPTKGSLFFETQFKAKKQSQLLEYAARLAENAGDDERAQALYQQRASLAPFSMAMVLRAVVNLVRRDKLPQALALMQKHDQQVPAEAFEYWRLLSQIAWDAGQYGVAKDAYQRYAALPQANSGDWSRLIFLVRQNHPSEAADLSLAAFRRFGLMEQLLHALGIYAELGDVAAQARIFNSLDAKTTAEAQQVVRFLMLRAQFYQRQKTIELAWLDLRRALQKSPREKDVVLANLWFLIDGQHKDLLATFLKNHASLASRDPAYWLAYAAANQTLERHPDAVHWYGKAVTLHADEPLMLLNYADALERINRVGMAERLRRHAWLQLKAKYPGAPTFKDLGQNAELLTFVRLALLNRPGDTGHELVRQLVTQLRGLSTDPIDEPTLALVLGWSILKEQYENARAWMWRRYAQQTQLAAPLWGQSQTALQLKDTHTMAHLLSTSSKGMPIYNRYDTAFELGYAQQALDTAFEGMTQHEDESLYERFRQHAPAQAHYLQLRAWADNQGTLDSRGLQFETQLAINSRLRVVLNWSRAQQSSTEPVLASLAPTSDQLGSIQARWQGSRGLSTVTLFRREELSGLAGFRLSQSYQWGARLNLEAGLDFRNQPSASQPLRLAGYENSLYASLGYSLGKREYWRLAPHFSSYYTQFGDYLGTGRQLDMEAGYRIRTEYPDWRIRLFATHQRFSRDGSLSAASAAHLPLGFQTFLASGIVDPLAYFIPEGSTTWGACLGMGENLGGQNLQTVYSRAWRPFADLCINHNTSTGNGYNGTLGVAGSLMGEDHLQMQLQNSDGVMPGSAPTNSLAIRYRHYY